MSFSNAIPLNRVTYSQSSEFSRDSGPRWTRRDGATGKQSKQSVNISPDTLFRLARHKLSKAVHQKLAYDQRGVLGHEANVGQLLSVKV